ncbi:MAG: Hsp20/alpha crystallin family protein [Deltaproteobacteria bacterium]|nr:Hsp20/alpha crystallin family protein [Deltaproteobacteria bacterium]
MGALALFDPFKEFNRLERALPNLFGQWGGSELSQTFSPSLEIREDAEAYRVKVEVPGLKKDHINVSVHDGVLHISGEKTEEKVKTEGKEGEANYYSYSERSFGKFKRSLSLPENVVSDQVEAEVKDGVLSIKIPKQAKPEPKTIEVKGS